MIIEDAISLIISLLHVDTLDFSEYIDTFITVIHYIDYFDSLIPVKLLIGCCAVILTWTVFCCIIRLVLYLL